MPQPNRIRELREAKGLSQEALAKRANTSSQQISRLEKGERGVDLDWIAILAKALECEAWEILPPSMTVPPDTIEFFNDLRDLSPEQRNLVRALIEQMKPRD